MVKNIGLGICGSFCTHKKILEVLKSLIAMGYNVLPIITESVRSTNTRFGRAKDFIMEVEKITGHEVIDSLVKAEPVGPNNLIDVLVVAPCTGNTLSKLANAITDNALTMVAKSHLRNNKPIVIGISSNDALGQNAINLAKLLSAKNFYFVPFMQDDFEKKPKSLICNWDLIADTIEEASIGKQIQPLLLGGGKWYLVAYAQQLLHHLGKVAK